MKNERPSWCHLAFYFTSYVLNMFRTLIYPSSGACDCVDELPHLSSCSQFVVCWSFWWGWFQVVVVFQEPAKRTPPKTSRTKSSNTQRTENKTTDVVIHQHSRKRLMMDILISETCWAHKKWNKVASDIKLVFHSSTITMMHGPINIRRQDWYYFFGHYEKVSTCEIRDTLLKSGAYKLSGDWNLTVPNLWGITDILPFRLDLPAQ